MAVDLPVLITVEGNELIHEVLACLLPARGVTLKVGESSLRDWARGNLGLEQIYLVQE